MDFEAALISDGCRSMTNEAQIPRQKNQKGEPNFLHVMDSDSESSFVAVSRRLPRIGN